MYRGVRRRLVLVVGGVIVLAELGAPLFTQVFGAQYSHDATEVLRLLVLATLPRGLNILAMCAARARRRISFVVKVHLALALLVPVSALLLGHAVGLVGFGIAWAGSQAVVALAVLIGEMRSPVRAWVPAPASSPRPASAEETMVIVRRIPLVSTIVPRHTTLIDADPTMVVYVRGTGVR
jgi:hypothetical protein